MNKAEIMYLAKKYRPKQTLMDRQRGIRGRIKHRQCEHGVWVVEDYEPKVCEKCSQSSNYAFFIPDTTPFFNLGLGCMTNGTRHAEKIAKQKGLTPIGDAPLKGPEPYRVPKEVKETIIREYRRMQ